MTQAARSGGDAVVPVDHVWSNVRVFLAGTRHSAACQLGGDRLGPHLAALADHAVVVGDRVHAGPGWSAAIAHPDAAPFADASFDLVVVEDVDRTGRSVRRIVEEARRLVGPAGWLVLGSSSRRSAWAVRRGLGDDRSEYAAFPSPRRPAVLLDLGDGRAGRYFMRHVAFAYRAPGRRGAKALFEQVRNRAAIIAPARVALAATAERVAVLRGDRASAALADQLGSLIGSSWGSLGLPGRPPDRLSPLVIAHRKTDSAVLSLILLGGSVPLVAKLPRYGGPHPAVRRESETLEAVFGAVAGPIRDTLPRPLGLHVVEGTDVLLQTVVPGRHLVAETAAKRPDPVTLRRQLDLMFAWSSRFQQATGRWVTVDDVLIDATLVPSAKAATAALNGDARVEALLDRAIEHARALVGTPVRLTVSHGDYWAGNVLVEGGRITGVVDWERATLEDLPIWDPVKAVMDAAFHLDRYRSVRRRGPGALPRWGELGPWLGTADPRCAVGFRAAAVGPGWLAELARQALVQAFIDAEIPLGWLPVALPFHLAREFVHPDASSRSVAGWGSVLRALATWPGTWADEFAGDRRGARPARGQASDGWAKARGGASRGA